LFRMRSLAGFGELVGAREPLAGFVDGTLRVVVGLDSETVLLDGAVTLTGDVEDFADSDVAPDFSPAWFSVAAESIAISIDCGLVVALSEEDLADAIARERALRVGLKRLLIFG